MKDDKDVKNELRLATLETATIGAGVMIGAICDVLRGMMMTCHICNDDPATYEKSENDLNCPFACCDRCLAKEIIKDPSRETLWFLRDDARVVRQIDDYVKASHSLKAH